MNPDNNMAMLKRPVNPSFGWTRSDARHPHKVSYRRRRRRVTLLLVARMVMAETEMVKAMKIATTLPVAVMMKLMLRKRTMMISPSR